MDKLLLEDVDVDVDGFICVSSLGETGGVEGNDGPWKALQSFTSFFEKLSLFLLVDLILR